jgi:hypothetical protein
VQSIPIHTGGLAAIGGTGLTFLKSHFVNPTFGFRRGSLPKIQTEILPERQGSESKLTTEFAED